MIQHPDPPQDEVVADRLVVGRSLDILPGLEGCGAYFLDGDHNYHTLRHELEVIQRTATRAGETGGGPVVFMHDVSWPFGRRDMYHDPAGIPAEGRHEYSETLGISLDGDALIDGGFRSPGQYAIATHPGGPRNGVLTAVEDFLASDLGHGWQVIIVPAAFGLAILYRSDDTLPLPCRDHLNALRAAMDITGGFLESCEANFLTLYLYSEHTRYELDQQTRALDLEKGAHFQTLEAYRDLEQAAQRAQSAHQQSLEAYQALEKAMGLEHDAHQRTLGAYRDLENTYHGLNFHAEASAQEYGRLQGAYADLSKEYETLLGHCHNLQRHVDQLATTTATPQEGDGDLHPGPEMLAGSGSRQ